MVTNLGHMACVSYCVAPSQLIVFTPYNKRVAVWFWTWLGWIPFGLTVETIDKQLPVVDGALSKILLPAYGLFWIFTGFRIGVLQCPRCHREFDRRGWWRNSFTSRCLHCGLPRGATLAQTQANNFDEIELSWRRISRLVLAVIELCIGLLATIFGVFSSPPSRPPFPPILFAAAGIICFVLPGALLLRRSRWRWLPQLLPAVAVGAVLIAVFRRRASDCALHRLPAAATELRHAVPT